jgi:hypothetical protein
MPWPLCRSKTDLELTAICTYLTAIPPLPDNPNRNVDLLGWAAALRASRREIVGSARN